MHILLMTGYSDERQHAHNLDALAHAVLAKPFDLATPRPSPVAMPKHCAKLPPRSSTIKLSRRALYGYPRFRLISRVQARSAPQ
mgnify:CR=1 FL=1